MEANKQIGKFERKIQQQRESFYVSLPVSWIKANGLHRYDRIVVELMGDGSVRLTPRGQCND